MGGIACFPKGSKVSSGFSPWSDVSATGKTPRILVVDDEDDVRVLVKTILNGARYSVMTACGGAEAIEIAARDRPDLILLDVMMPEISGWEVCSMLKNSPETQSIPVVMLSVKNEIRDMITSMQAGADHQLPKPFFLPKPLRTVPPPLHRGVKGPPPFFFSSSEDF